MFNYNFIAQWCALLADSEARLISDQLLVSANIGKAISVIGILAKSHIGASLYNITTNNCVTL